MSTSKDLYNPGRYITIDEMMIAYRGRYSTFRQYMKAKPTKYGFKFWAAMSTESRYIYNVIPYLEKQGAVDIGQSEHVVLDLIHGLEYRKHIIVVDNFFTSPSLFEKLLDLGTYTIGTLKGPRIGVPSLLCGFKRGEHPRSTLFWLIHQDHKMAATTWFDSKSIFLSTSSDPVAPGPPTCKCWVNGRHEDIDIIP